MEGATQMLRRAVDLDTSKRYREAKVCYEEGIELLLKAIPTILDTESQQKIRDKVRNYMKRAEELKEFVIKEKKAGKFHEKIDITQNQRGCSYTSLFSKYINEDLTTVTVKDAYIRAHHQIVNFVKFSELLLRKAKNLKMIHLTTGRDDNQPDEQQSKLTELQNSLKSFDVVLQVVYSDVLHDREIVFDNGWIIKIGRGLDYFKSPKGRMSIGAYDMDFRECHETTVDIYDAR